MRRLLLAASILAPLAAHAQLDDAMLAAVQPHLDAVQDILNIEHARVAALLAHDPDTVEMIAHPDFVHRESNGRFRRTQSFVEAMRWCGPDGVSPNASVPMPAGGGFSFAAHDIDWQSVHVRLLSDTEAEVTGAYSNILRRCYLKPDGTAGVETPPVAKPATFERRYLLTDGRWLLREHVATVSAAAPPASLSVNFPPQKD